MSNNTLGDQNRSFGYADAPSAGQLMTPQVIPRGMMSPGHQSMRPGFVPQQMTSQFYHSHLPRTPLACYGKPPDMQLNTPCQNARYLENSPQPKNYFYTGPAASYNSPNQMLYNEGNFYQHQTYPQIPQQQNYYKHQMSPMPPQSSGFYHEMSHQSMGYPQRMMSEQIPPHNWNSPHKIQPQMLDGSAFGDCTMQKIMQVHTMDRFHTSNSSNTQGHPAMLKERYMSPPHMSSGFDPRIYNNYGYEGHMEKYKMNTMKYPEEQMYGMQNPTIHASQQLGNYLPGKRLEHFSNQPNPHFQIGNYGMVGNYPPDAKVPPSEIDKIKFHNPNPYCNPSDPTYYKTNNPDQMNHFKHSQRKLLYPDTPTHMDEGMIKKPADAELEAYHSPSTETCSGSSSPSYFEVDVKYSLPSSGFPIFSSPSLVPQRVGLLDSAIKTEPLSSINFLISQNQSSMFSQTFSQLPTLSLEKQKPSMINCITTGTISITTSVTIPMTTSLNQSLLLQSSKCITSTVKMATPSKNNSMVVVRKEFPPIQRQVGRGDEGLPKAVTPRKNKRRKVFEDMRMISVGRTSVVQRYVTVPYKWRRIIENESVYYISPSRVRLESLKEICQYLLTDGTCKCGLLCPLHVDQVFVFDCAIKSRYMTVEEVFNSSNNVASLCYHKRKYKQSVSAAIIAASGGNCRSNQQVIDRRKEDLTRSGENVNKLKGISPNECNSSLAPRFPHSNAGKMIRKRAYTKVKEKRKSKLETSLCDSLKNTQQQHYPSTLPSTFPKQGTPPTSAFTVFQGQLKDPLQAKSSAMDSYDSDATKSASDIYCSSSGSDDEEDNLISKPPGSSFRTNLIKLPGVVSNNGNSSIVASTQLMYTSTLMTLSSVSSSLDVTMNKPILLNHLSVPQNQLNSDLETSTEIMFGDMTKGFRKTQQDPAVDPSPIKMVEDMVSGLLTTRNSLAEVTALMMSKVEFDKRRKIPIEISEVSGVAEEREMGSTSRMDEAIHQSVSKHLRHLDTLKTSSLIKPASISFSSGTSISLSSLTMPGTSRFSLLPSISSKSDSTSVALSSSASDCLVMSAPGFFFDSPLETINKLIPKTRSSNVSKSSNPPASKIQNVGKEEMFSEDEDDNNSCVVIENWLEEGGLDKSGGSASRDTDGTTRVTNSEVKPKQSATNSAQLGDDDLMKTTGTQTSTPASNVSNSTLELVDHDGDSRETICCTGVENTISLDDTTFASIVSSSFLPSIPSKTSPRVSPMSDNSIISSQNIVSCITTSNISLAAISNECNISSVLAPQQVPQAQVVMVPTQQPFLIPHHQTFDAQLYQTSPAGYLQSLGFGFAQGQVGLLHFGQVVAPASTSSSQGLGLALGLGVSLSGSAGRDQTIQPLLESVQNSSSTSLVNTSSSSSTIQSSGQESSTQSGSELSVALTNQDQSQACTSSVTANQLFQLVVSQGVQPAHHILVPNYSSFAPFAGAALVPVPMVQQNSMAFCNLVAASGAPTLFTVGQSPFGFVAGPAAMQMLTGVNVGEKRQESTASHDAPDSTVDSEDAVVVPCISGNNNSGEDGGNSSIASSTSDAGCAQVISSSRSSTESMTSQASVTSVPSSCISSKLEESLKDVNELSSSSETDDEIGFVMIKEGCSKTSGDVKDSKEEDDDDDDDDDDQLTKDKVDHNDEEKIGKRLENKIKLCTKKFENNKSSKTFQYVGVTKLLKQTKNKKLKAFLSKSRLASKSTSHLSRSSICGRGTSRLPNHTRTFSPALSVLSENNSEVASGETTTPCSSSGDCMVTTTDSTATESAYRADGSQSRPLSTCKDILSKNLRKNKGKLRLSCRSHQKPDSPISSDDTIDDVDSTTTTTPASCQGSRSFNIGDLVWGPARGFPSWPGKLVPENEVKGNPKPESGKIWVKWFGDNTYAQTDPDQLKTLSEGLETHHNARKSHRRGRKMNAGLEAAIQEAMTELDKQMADHKSSCSSASGGSTSSGSTCSGDRPSKKSRRC